MKCRNCPYGQEDFYRRMAWYNKMIFTVIYNLMKPLMNSNSLFGVIKSVERFFVSVIVASGMSRIKIIANEMTQYTQWIENNNIFN